MSVTVESHNASGFNDGIFVLGRGTRPAIDTDPKTVIVSGLARSGTTSRSRISSNYGARLRRGTCSTTCGVLKNRTSTIL